MLRKNFVQSTNRALNVLERAILSVHVWLIDLPRYCTLLSDIVFGRVRLGATGFPHGAFPQRSSCGEPFLAQATGAFPGAEGVHGEFLS